MVFVTTHCLCTLQLCGTYECYRCTVEFCQYFSELQSLGARYVSVYVQRIFPLSQSFCVNVCVGFFFFFKSKTLSSYTLQPANFWSDSPSRFTRSRQTAYGLGLGGDKIGFECVQVGGHILSPTAVVSRAVQWSPNRLSLRAFLKRRVRETATGSITPLFVRRCRSAAVSVRLSAAVSVVVGDRRVQNVIDCAAAAAEDTDQTRPVGRTGPYNPVFFFFFHIVPDAY